MPSWEYTYLTETTLHVEDLKLRLTALGSLGWEMCGFAAADPTLGVNSYTAFLKREVESYPRPDDVAKGWRSDPSGRGEQRFWDGFRWTEHVTTAGVQSTDFPNVR